MLDWMKSNLDVVVEDTNANCEICYQEHLCDIVNFMRYFYKEIEINKNSELDMLFPGLCKKIDYNKEAIEQMVFSGVLVAYRNYTFYAFDLSKAPTRNVTDSIVEAEGGFQSRDGFVENYKDNIALIRTRVRDSNLKIDNFTIGKRSKTTVNLFAGLLRCADCGRSMNRRHNKHSYGTYTYYVCSTFKKMDKGACTKHTIRLDRLEAAVLAAIKMQIQLAVDMEQAIEVINQYTRKNTQSEKLQKQLDVAKKDEAQAESMILDLYPDWKMGMITSEEYRKLKSKLEEKLLDARGRIEQIEMLQSGLEDGQDASNEFIQKFLQYRNVETLTRDLLVTLVDTIYVYEGGDIHIDFKFQSPFLMAKEYIENNMDTLDEETRNRVLLSA